VKSISQAQKDKNFMSLQVKSEKSGNEKQRVERWLLGGVRRSLGGKEKLLVKDKKFHLGGRNKFKPL
jgi:hypothetical protein